jgi:hypothetical protein
MGASPRNPCLERSNLLASHPAYRHSQAVRLVLWNRKLELNHLCIGRDIDCVTRILVSINRPQLYNKNRCYDRAGVSTFDGFFWPAERPGTTSFARFASTLASGLEAAEVVLRSAGHGFSAGRFLFEIAFDA